MNAYQQSIIEKAILKSGADRRGAITEACEAYAANAVASARADMVWIGAVLGVDEKDLTPQALIAGIVRLREERNRLWAANEMAKDLATAWRREQPQSFSRPSAIDTMLHPSDPHLLAITAYYGAKCGGFGVRGRNAKRI